MSRTPSTSTQEIQMDIFDNPTSQGKYAKRKSRFKRSDGSTSSDTTSNSFVRQVSSQPPPERPFLDPSSLSPVGLGFGGEVGFWFGRVLGAGIRL
ncbi:hypothetical protein AAFF_G00051750 [Aldrovandia affinis]|uniref:Uncharacterized protein n=1 Tax=Aldrovandia affinis TaxID=143900 RepID=A0AAD7T4K4_9TELE|nr:hypothetical protein AAFF_G00051750 [Aldrovandia affinis]